MKLTGKPLLLFLRNRLILQSFESFNRFQEKWYRNPVENARSHFYALVLMCLNSLKNITVMKY